VSDLTRTRKFLFTITPGHTGTTWLAQVLSAHLPDSRVFHEILGYDRFGVDTPDLSHMTLFNSQGNVAKVRDFWRQKAARIIAEPSTWYGETSHLLAKCGLLENIELFTDVGEVYVLCLERELADLVKSMRQRHDMINKGNQWLWHLDPDYPRKLVARGFFEPHGVDGTRLWYACEMRARAAYYRQLLEQHPRVHFISRSIEALVDPGALQALLQGLGVDLPAGKIAVPARSNVSRREQSASGGQIDAVIRDMTFDPEQIAANYLAKGYRLGAEQT
jgi:hypothetical protein